MVYSKLYTVYFHILFFPFKQKRCMDQISLFYRSFHAVNAR